MESLSFISEKMSGFFGGFGVNSMYIQAGAIVFLLFLLVLSMAQFRRHFIKANLEGGMVGIFFGVLLTLIIEGFLLIGGKTVLTEMLGWKNAPKPFKTALDIGHNKLVDVLGVTDQIPTSVASDNMSSSEAVEILQSLNPDEIKKVKSIICSQ